MRAFVQARDATTERGADERAFLAVHDATDSGTGPGGPTDDQCALAPRPMRTRRATPRLVRRAVHHWPIRAAVNAGDSGHSFAADEPVANDGMLARPARQDERSGERLNATEESQHTGGRQQQS